MEERFIPVNAVIAMYSTVQTSWPRPFYDVGYLLEALELPVVVGDDARVPADLVGFRPSNNRFLLHEAKSGANVDEDQAARYQLADPLWLVRATKVNLTADEDPSCQTVYVCLRSHEDRILLGLRKAECAFPLVSVGDSDVRAVGASFDDDDLAARFENLIPLPGPPPGIIVVDIESADEDFDEIVFPTLVAEMSLRTDDVSVITLAERSIPYLNIYPEGVRRRLIKRVEAAAQRAAQADEQHFEFRAATMTRPYAIIKLSGNPEDLDPRGRTQRYQAIASRFQTRPRPRVAAIQEALFDDLDLERELSLADEDEREEEN
jgi:hypothetical protein